MTILLRIVFLTWLYYFFEQSQNVIEPLYSSLYMIPLHKALLTCGIYLESMDSNGIIPTSILFVFTQAKFKRCTIESRFLP